MIIYAGAVFLLFASEVLASTSYQYVKFITKPHPQPQANLHNVRPARSFDGFPIEYVDVPEDLWHNSDFFQPGNNILDVTLGAHHTHFTPDYSDGLEYPDPLLLTGHDARRAVSYIYGKGELFFHNIPHIRGLLNMQEMRRENGLPPNRLGSLRSWSPWYRDENKPLFANF